MKPKDLKFPFSWDERLVLLKDRVLYIPEYYDRYEDFHFPDWEDPQIFGNNKPVIVEYCSGNGTWIAKKAKDHPSYNWVAVEKRFDRVRKIWSKIKNDQLDNLFVICGEGLRLTREYIRNETVDQVYVNFPDPWPKKRHAKNRIIQSPFAEQMGRILKVDGVLTMVTDDPTYSEQMIEVLQQQEGMGSLYPEPYFVTELEGYGTSYFDTLWRDKGRVIRYHQYRKQGCLHAVC
jgi:tRNA (guanine-N7-)-methyltransferase